MTGEHLLFSFLTTESNDDVRPIHAKALPEILTTEDDYERWLAAPVEEAPKLQWPLPAGALEDVATRTKKVTPDLAA